MSINSINHIADDFQKVISPIVNKKNILIAVVALSVLAFNVTAVALSLCELGVIILFDVSLVLLFLSCVNAYETEKLLKKCDKVIEEADSMLGNQRT